MSIRPQRGLTMVIALVVVAVLLFIAVVLLSNAFGSVANESAIRAKIAAFDAAEAGIDKVVELLNVSGGSASNCGPNAEGEAGPSLADGGSYTLCIEYNGTTKQSAANVSDRGTHASISVPAGMVFAWSSGVAQNGGRAVLVEALIAPSQGLQLPPGPINAAGDVNIRSDAGVYASAAGADDASIYANHNIYEFASPKVVEGQTFAGGVDQLSGGHDNAALLTFPSADQIAGAAQSARAAAVSGSLVSVPPTYSGIISGSTFINGDLKLQQGTVVFQGARSVFINGNLCVQGQARVINDAATIWVTGNVSTSGSGAGYVVAPGSSGTLVALGADDGRPCSNAQGKHAVILDSGPSQSIGTVYAPNGSIDLIGSGLLVGAVNAGGNVDLDDQQGGGIQYDAASKRLVPSYNFKIVSYMEY